MASLGVIDVYSGPPNATLLMANCTVQGRMLARQTSPTIRDSFFTNNLVFEGIGACLQIVDIGRLPAVVENSVFSRCLSSFSGGAVGFVSSNTTAFIRNSRFDSNRAKVLGGAIFSDADLADLRIDNCSFIKNAIALDQGNIENQLQSSGSAVYSSGPILSVAESLFQENYFLQPSPEVSFDGGALWAAGKMDVRRTIFDSNFGGALDHTTSMTGSLISDCIFNNNTADFKSLYGALRISLTDANATISNVMFSNNVFRALGGAVVNINSSASTLNVIECSFLDNGPSNTAPNAMEGATLLVASFGSQVVVENCLFHRNGAFQGAGAILVTDGNVYVRGSRTVFSNNTIADAAWHAEDIKVVQRGHVFLDLGIPLTEGMRSIDGYFRTSNIVIDAPDQDSASIAFVPTADGSVATFGERPSLRTKNAYVDCRLVKCVFNAGSFFAAGSRVKYIAGPAGIDFNSLLMDSNVVYVLSSDGQSRPVTAYTVSSNGSCGLVLLAINLQTNETSNWKLQNGITTISFDKFSNLTLLGPLSISRATLNIASQANNVTLPRMQLRGPILVQDSNILLFESRAEIVAPSTFIWQKNVKGISSVTTNWLDVPAIQLLPSTDFPPSLLMSPSEFIFNHTLQGPILHEQVPFILADTDESIVSQVDYRPSKYSWPNYADFNASHGYYGRTLTVRTLKGPATCGDRPEFPYFICDTTAPIVNWTTTGAASFLPRTAFPRYNLKVPVEITTTVSLNIDVGASIYFSAGSFLKLASPACIGFVGSTDPVYYFTVEFNASLAVRRIAELPPLNDSSATPSGNRTETFWDVDLPQKLFQMDGACFDVVKPLFGQGFQVVSCLDISGSLKAVTGCDYISCDLHFSTEYITIQCAPAPPSIPRAPAADAQLASSPTGAIVGGIIAAVAIAAIVIFVILFLRRRRQQPKPSATFPQAVELDEKPTKESVPLISGSIPFSDVSIMQELGKGSWGTVSLAVYQGEFVAVKRASSDATETQSKTLIGEAKLMSSLKAHRNLVKFVGICSDSASFGLMMEFCPRGSLSDYIRGNKGKSLSEYEIFKFAYGVLEGMVALASAGLVHRDLAARNVLLDENLLCKVSDFGSSRKSSQIENEKTKQSDSLGPIKWQPPEVLNNQTYSEKSDVWSFGCTLLEIVTRREPYFGFSGSILQLMQQIKDGSINPLIHAQKNGEFELPEWIVSVLQGCFASDPSSRPSFREIRFQINQKVRNLLTPYEAELDELESVLSPKHYSAVPTQSAVSWTGAQPTQQSSDATSSAPESRGLIGIESVERLGKLGAGAYGTVYLGKFQGQYVAIKVLSLTSADGQTVLREAEVMSLVAPHRNIVQLFGIAKGDDHLDIVMEFAPKGSCEDYVASAKSKKIGEALLFKWALGIARGMAHLTASKVVHRDLSARNVLLDSSLEPKIADFGLGRTVLDPNQESSTQTDVGPLRWFAPECFELKYSEKTDVWAYGCTLIELATGDVPMASKSVLEVAVAVRDHNATALDTLAPEIRSEIPDWLLQTMQKCFQRDAKDRPTFDELVGFIETKADSVAEIRDAEAAIQRRRNKRAGTILE
jgi:predicted outer membrane repeat protein